VTGKIDGVMRKARLVRQKRGIFGDVQGKAKERERDKEKKKESKKKNT